MTKIALYVNLWVKGFIRLPWIVYQDIKRIIQTPRKTIDYMKQEGIDPSDINGFSITFVTDINVGIDVEKE